MLMKSPEAEQPKKNYLVINKDQFNDAMTKSRKDIVEMMRGHSLDHKYPLRQVINLIQYLRISKTEGET